MFYFFYLMNLFYRLSVLTKNMKLLLIGLILTVLFGFISTQSQLNLLNNVNITYTNNGTHTQFVVISPLGQGVQISNSWLGVGLNSVGLMVSQTINKENEKLKQQLYEKLQPISEYFKTGKFYDLTRKLFIALTISLLLKYLSITHRFNSIRLINLTKSNKKT